LRTDGLTDSDGSGPSGRCHRGPYRCGEQLVDQRPGRRGEDRAGEHPGDVAGQQRRSGAGVGQGGEQGHGHHGQRAGQAPARPVRQPPSGQPGGAGARHHARRHDAPLVQDVLREQEDEGVSRSCNHRDGESQHHDHQQAVPERSGHDAEHGDRMPGSGRGHGEPVGLLDPAPEQGQQRQGDQRQHEHAPEPERARRQAVHDGDDPGAGAVPGGDERHCLARSAEAVCSAAVTCASPLLALSKGRPQAKMATNHQ